MKDESKDLALRVKHGYQIDILCQSCLFYDEAKKCTTPLPIQYQTVELGKGMVDCSNYLMTMAKFLHPEVISKNPLLEIKTNYLKMKGVPTRNLKLRHSMAKFLLRLVIEDRRRMAHIAGYGWYVDPLGPMMSDYLGNELQRIVKQLERK